MKAKKLNLGCGFNYKKDYINCDLREVKADKYFDLNKFPYPFEDNSIGEVILSHILEHLDNVVEVLSEVYRICKSKPIVKINTPYFSSESAFSDIEHRHFFTWTTLDAVDKTNPIHFRNPFCNSIFRFILFFLWILCHNFFKNLRFKNHSI